MASIYDKSSLVLIPSGTKTGKVYSQKPVSGDGDFTFTRSSAATRVNADGFIEKETQNLLYQSNNFESGFWITPSLSVTGGQSGYDGSSNAWLCTLDSNSGSVRQYVSASGVQTFSVYAKAGNTDWVALYIDSVSTDKPYVYFDLGNGVVGSNLNANAIAGKIEDAGGGWYRCSIIYSRSTNQVRIFPADSNNVLGTTGDTIYIQDVQLEQGLVARDYIETTSPVEGGITDNVPRLDYTDSSCPALLLEPQRTNADPNAEYLANRPIVVNVSTTTNSIDSPEGVSNATLITNNTTSGQHQLTDNTLSVTSGTDYTISLFLKYNDAQYVRLQFGGTPFGSTNWQNFDVLNGTKGSSGGGITSADASIEEYGNGWYRCIVTADATATGSNGAFQIRILEDDNTNDIPSFAGSGLSTYAWGAQFEAGSYATSYIPTYGSSVTRVQDLNLTASPSTSYFGQTEGTIFTEIKINAITSGSYSRIFNLKNSGGSNQIYFQQNDSRINSVVFNGSNQFSQSTSSGFLSVGSSYKMAMAYKDGDYAFYINGTQIGTSSTSGLGTLAVDRVDFTTLSGNINLGNEVKQSLVFNTRLTNAELADLTTL